MFLTKLEVRGNGNERQCCVVSVHTSSRRYQVVQEGNLSCVFVNTFTELVGRVASRKGVGVEERR